MAVDARGEQPNVREGEGEQEQQGRAPGGKLAGLVSRLFGRGGAPAQAAEEGDRRPSWEREPEAKKEKRPWVLPAEALPEETGEDILHARRQEEMERRRLEEDNLFSVKGNRLYAVYCKHNGFAPSMDPTAKFSYAVFMENEQLPDQEQRGWLQTYDRGVRTLPQYSEAGIPPGRSTNAVVYVRMSADRMGAWLFMLPPVNGGQEAEEAQVMRALEQQGITYGIDQDRIAEAVLARQYVTLIRIATGEAVVPGIDGKVIDRFLRQPELRLTEKDDDTIDYKDLGWLQTIFAGDVICDIVPPVPGTDGISVRGERMRAKPGKTPPVPAGQATHINPEGTALVAQMDGVLTFAAQRFIVDPLLVVKGDVDGGIGNLDTVGDVVVYGDVREGFTIEATGHIAVQGMVEGATLSAGGNIQIGRGMNGGGTGLLRAGGKVVSKFLENTRVEAYGDVVCDTAVNSFITTDGDLRVYTDRGVIVGCTVTSLGQVRAKAVGNRSGRASTITLGSSVDYLRDKAELLEKRDEVAETLHGVEKSIAFLSTSGPLTLNEGKQRESLETDRMVLRKQMTSLDQRLRLMEAKVENVEECSLTARAVYPPLTVNIGGAQAVIGEDCRDVRITMGAGDILVEKAEQ